MFSPTYKERERTQGNRKIHWKTKQKQIFMEYYLRRRRVGFAVCEHKVSLIYEQLETSADSGTAR